MRVIMSVDGCQAAQDIELSLKEMRRIRANLKRALFFEKNRALIIDDIAKKSVQVKVRRRLWFTANKLWLQRG